MTDLFQSTPPRERRQAATGQGEVADSDVSIHASAREATLFSRQTNRWEESFNPRLRARGDDGFVDTAATMAKFQSTPPRERRPSRPLISTRKERFQSTPPRERRLWFLRLRPAHQICFNPRLRARGDQIGETGGGVERVSIHASAREATAQATGLHHGVEFQSTPPRERRRIGSVLGRQVSMFQSTPPRERRRAGISGDLNGSVVSIHASAREATARSIADWATGTSFNPRLRARGDSCNRGRRWPTRRFNPRLRARGDSKRRSGIAPTCCFNPRLRARGDVLAGTEFG